jgi:hypothetical protein
LIFLKEFYRFGFRDSFSRTVFVAYSTNACWYNRRYRIRKIIIGPSELHALM